MPYQWTDPPDAPRAQLRAWPHRATSGKNIVIFFAATIGLAMIPMIAILGTASVWAVLPFFTLTFGGMYVALAQADRRARTRELLELDHEQMVLRHQRPGAPDQTWQANPWWVRPKLHRDHKIAQYLTLEGGPRSVELGAFLTPDEREALYGELTARLGALRSPNGL